MRLLYVLKRLYGKMRFFLNSDFNMPIEYQKKILNTFSEPKGDIERSFYQYKATMRTYGRLFQFLLNLASFFLIPYYILILKGNYKRLLSSEVKECDAVFLTDGIIIETIPDSLREEFSNIIMENFTDNMCLSNNDISFLQQIFKRYPISFHFQLKCIMKIGMYSAQLLLHTPQAIISYTEGAFTSSVATEYCESHEIEHINIMHGEMYFVVHTSFFRFSRYYVWDQYYVDLFKSLHAPVSQFIIELPETLKRNLFKKENYKYYITYYLANEKEHALLLIKECFDKLKVRGKNCAVRIHPRWSNEDVVKKIFYGYDIEEAKLITMKESLEDTKYVASLRSTALFEGYCNGKEIILDDYSNRGVFEKLVELNYIMLSKPHKLLSQVIEENR